MVTYPYVCKIFEWDEKLQTQIYHRRKPSPKCTILSQFWREQCGIRYRGLRRWNTQTWLICKRELSHLSEEHCSVSLAFFLFRMQELFEFPYQHTALQRKRMHSPSWFGIIVFRPSWKEVFIHVSKDYWGGGGYTAFMDIVQWGFLSVPHLLWHRASVYNGH